MIQVGLIGEVLSLGAVHLCRGRDVTTVEAIITSSRARYTLREFTLRWPRLDCGQDHMELAWYLVGHLTPTIWDPSPCSNLVYTFFNGGESVRGVSSPSEESALESPV